MWQLSGGHGIRTHNRFPGTTFPVWPLAIRLPSKLGKNRVFQEMASSWTTTGLHRTRNLSSARLREYTQRSASVDPGLCLNPIGQNDRKGRQPAAPGVLAASGRPAGPLRQAHPLRPLPPAEPYPPLGPHHPRRRPLYFLRISSTPGISGPIRWIALWQFAQRIARSFSLVFTRLVASDNGARWCTSAKPPRSFP